MTFNFYEEFSPYSTVELLKIMSQPERYQPEALAAAERLLKERTISPEDLEETALFFQQMKEGEIARAKKFTFYQDKVTDIVGPVLIPGPAISPARWYRIFLWIYGIYYVFIFYRFVKEQIFYLRCESCYGASTVWGGLINITYLSILFFLLLKNKRWGWILLLVGNIGSFMTGFYQLKLWYGMRDFIHVSTGLPLFFILFPFALVVFLWRRPIADFFGVDKQTKVRSAWAGVGFGIIYYGFLLL